MNIIDKFDLSTIGTILVTDIPFTWENAKLHKKGDSVEYGGDQYEISSVEALLHKDRTEQSFENDADMFESIAFRVTLK
jgi:hypothetical protein